MSSGSDRTLLGVLIITILDDGLNLLGVNQYLQMVIKGAVVIAAVLVSQDRDVYKRQFSHKVGPDPVPKRNLRFSATYEPVNGRRRRQSAKARCDPA